MKIFVDTANIEEIKTAFSYGIVDGLTTNPSLIKQASQLFKQPMEAYINSILITAGKAPVSLEVKGGNANDMIKQGLNLYKHFSTKANLVVIKIPFNPTVDEKKPQHFEGLKAIKELAGRGIPVNVTLIFTPEQAMLAAKAGAAYVSPFVGRIDDKLRTDAGMKFDKAGYYPLDGMEQGGRLLEDNGIVSGVDLIEQIVYIFDSFAFTTEVLAASIRNARQAREVALAGADVATIPFNVLTEMTQHPKSLEGMKAFLADTVKDYEVLM
ncbi:transaldolase [Candidatus Woesearchaeota archaeon]|nr:transaldolase [Candidatus Woesearchaeota archaeon]